MNVNSEIIKILERLEKHWSFAKTVKSIILKIDNDFLLDMTIELLQNELKNVKDEYIKEIGQKYISKLDKLRQREFLEKEKDDEDCENLLKNL